MTQVNRLTGGSDEFIKLIRRIEGRVSSLETRGTGSIFISDQIITQDPVTGVETIFGALPDGRYGLQEWVNDTEPPLAPSQPVVSGDRAIYEITWDGLDFTGAEQPPDYARTVVQMSSSLSGAIWIEVGYFTAAGRVVVANQEYGQEKHFRLVSYDKNGNASEPSGFASATLVSFMDSPEMTNYILDVESSVTTANNTAASAQSAAQAAADKAENAEKLAQAASSSATSMVKNGSFELDFESWTKETANGTISTTTAYEGTKSWEIGTAGSGIYQTAIPVTQGDVFVYEMHYKTVAGYAGSGGLRLQTSTDGVTFTNTVSGSCTENLDWALQSVEYTVAAGVTHIRPRIAFTGASTMGVWVDSVKLTNVTAMRKLEKTANDAKDLANQAAIDAEEAARVAGLAADAANGKNTVWRQPTKPAGTSHRINDIWFDTDDENKIHTWDGNDWIGSRDGAIDRAFTDIGEAESAAASAAQAAADAATAASTADGKAESALGASADAVTAANSAETKAGNALSAASAASTKADDAFTAANGKNKITPSFDPAPASYVGTVGDMWWQKSTTAPFQIIVQSTWNGTAWTTQTLGNDVISDLNAGKLNAGTIAAARIGANTITADKLLVGSTTNLVPDPTFTSATVWTANRQTTGGKDGGGSLLIPTGSTLRGFYFGDTSTTTAFRIPVNPGGKYRVSVWVQTSTVAALNTISVYGKAWKSTATTTTTSTTPSVLRNTSATVANTWYRITGILEIPAGYDRLTLGFYAEAAFTGTARFSNPIIQEAATGELIVDGSITTLKMAADSITAESGIIASLDASKITVGELEGARVKAGTVTADKLVVGQGNNLIADPRFSQGSSLTNARLAASTAGAAWTTPDYVGWNKATASATVHNFKLGGLASNVNSPVITAIPGRKYIVSWKVYADNAGTNTRAVLKWLSRTDILTTSTGPNIALKSTGLSSYSQEFTAPADAAFLNVELEFTSHPGGGWIDFYQPSIELMTDGTIITEDAILTKHIKAGEITGGVLDMAYIKGQVITGTMFEGQTFTGGQFQSATFETSPLATKGIKMSPTLGLVGYNTNNQTVFQVDPSGNATFTGTVNILEGSTVPESTIPGLTETLDDHQGMADTVWGWTDPANRTLINGGNIATNSITANQIALGAGTNFVSGGDGGDNRGWDDFQYFSNVPAGYPPNSKGVYALTGPKLGYSPAFNVAGLNKYSFSYFYNCPQTNILHETFLAFYDINSSFISSVSLGRRGVSSPGLTGSPSITNQTAPAGAVTARIYIEHNWKTGDASGSTYFSDFKVTTGAQTMLTSSGLSSFNNGVQTLRLNGEDNLMIGEVMTGRPGVEPYIKISSRTNVAAMDFYSIPDTNQTNHAGIWWQVDVGGTGVGRLRLYAMDDPPVISGNRFYAAGIDMHSDGVIEFQGKLGRESETIQSNTMSFPSGFGPNGTSNTPAHYGTYTISFNSPYPTGVIPNVIVSMTASAGSEVVATVKSVTRTGFEVLIVNFSPRNSGTGTKLNWVAIRI